MLLRYLFLITYLLPAHFNIFYHDVNSIFIYQEIKDIFYYKKKKLKLNILPI